MAHIIVRVEHEGKVLSEVERELDFDIVNDKWDKGTYVEMSYPEWAGVWSKENAVTQAVDLAEQFLNENPEIWGHE